MNKLMIALALTVAAGGALAADKPSAAPAGKSASQTAQQQKMVGCSKESKGKKGDERKAFMKACLSKKA
jgi:hypothetical protein